MIAMLSVDTQRFLRLLAEWKQRELMLLMLERREAEREERLH